MHPSEHRSAITSAAGLTRRRPSPHKPPGPGHPGAGRPACCRFLTATRPWAGGGPVPGSATARHTAPVNPNPACKIDVRAAEPDAGAGVAAGGGWWMVGGG